MNGTSYERTFIYLYGVQVSTSLADAFDDYSCFGEDSFFIVSKVSKWNKDQLLSKVR
jgi:hypothetical protein